MRTAKNLRASQIRERVKPQGTHDWTSRVVIALGISCLRQLEVRSIGKTHIGYHLALDVRSERNETL